MNNPPPDSVCQYCGKDLELEGEYETLETPDPTIVDIICLDCHRLFISYGGTD